MGLFSNLFGRLIKGGGDVPVDDQMGQFNDIFIPVQSTTSPAHWGISATDEDYVVPQSQEEHNKLLNTFFDQRAQYPNWQELGEEVEAKANHLNDTDTELRKKVGARSSVIQDMAFNPSKNLAWLKMNNQWYTYSATPRQFQDFLRSGSLGRAMNNIKFGRGGTMNKTAARIQPEVSSGNFSSFGKLFGF